MSNFLTSQTGQQIISIHIFPSASRIKGNQPIKLGQLVEYNVRNILLQTSCKEWGRETITLTLFVF